MQKGFSTAQLNFYIKIVYFLDLTKYFGTINLTENLSVRFSFFIYDEIIKNDFDSCVRSCLTKVRASVLILTYNCFTHELLIPEVRFFKKNESSCFSFQRTNVS